MSRTQIADLKEGLQRLYKARRENPSFDGSALYQNILDEVAVVLKRISIGDFRPRGCNLFDKCDDYWLRSFKENFHKLFIDRERFCKPLRYNHFNDRSLGNLCYAEGFALGFLTMLIKAQEMLKSGQKDLSPQDFVQLYISLNAVALVQKEGTNKTSLAIRGGNKVKFLPACEMAPAEGGRTLFEFSKSEIRTIYEAGFDHEARVIEFYKTFCDEAKRGKNIDAGICHLVNVLASHAHLCLDGNNRAAILCGWLLAITHNVSFPVLFNQFCVDEKSIAEGSAWSAGFMADPNIDALGRKAGIVQVAITEENYADLQRSDPVAFFLYELISKSLGASYTLCVSIPLNYEKPIMAVAGGSVFPASLKLMDERWSESFSKMMGKDDKIFCAKYLCEAISELDDRTLRQDNKNELIAVAYMKKISANLDDLTSQDRTLCEIVITNCKTDNPEFREYAARYLAVFPRQQVLEAQVNPLAVREILLQ